MPRAALFALLAAFILSGSLQAQRAGGAYQGNAAGMAVRSGFAGQRGFPNGFSPRSGFFPRRGVFPIRFHVRHDGFGGGVVPFFVPYEERFEYEQPYPPLATMEPAPPVVWQTENRQVLTPAAPPAMPQVIEIPLAANSTVAKSLPPTIFILVNGDRLESRRFMLTANNLFISIDRNQRTIPLVMLNINATIAANHERGIDLRIPADRNEISLSF